jgi:pyruvate/2-oxoglutarate/acetoin dehydrogenase E1 component
MPVMSRSFALLQAVEYEMQQRPTMVYSQQGSIGSATRADGKSINLLDEFGLDRCIAKFGQGIDEDWMCNSAIGYAFTQNPAVVQTVSMAPLWTIDFMESQAGMLQTQVGGQLKCPMVLVQPGAGRTSVTQHANVSAEDKYPNCPGLVTVLPYFVYDVKGLMHASIRYGGPVAYLSYSGQASADIPDEAFVVPLGKNAVVSAGKDLTLATYGLANTEVLKALPLLEKEGIVAEHIDCRTLKPFDEETLLASVKKTGKLFCVSFGYWTHDFTGHIMAVAAMGAPGTKMWRITYPDIAPPFSKEMNRWNIPDSAKIVDAVKKFVRM